MKKFLSNCFKFQYDWPKMKARLCYIVSRFVITLELIIFAYTGYVYLMTIIPNISNDIILDNVLTIVFIFLQIFALRSLYKAITTKGEVKKTPERLSHKSTDQTKRYCKNCQIHKMELDHHCSMCNRCIYRLDHHCFFVGQCVGDYNFSYFISYVMYVNIYSVYCSILLYREINLVIQFRFSDLSVYFLELLLLVFLCIYFFCFSISLLVQHFYFISNDITFIEFKHRFKEPKHLPCKFIWTILKFQYFKEYSAIAKQRWISIFGTPSLFAIFFPDNTDQEVVKEIKEATLSDEVDDGIQLNTKNDSLSKQKSN